MTLIRHRLPADSAVVELNTLSSSSSSLVVGDGVGTSVVGTFITEKDLDWAPQSFRVNTMVRLSPAERRQAIRGRSELSAALRGRGGRGDSPLSRMERSLKLAQQLLKRTVVFPASPTTRSPLAFFRLAVTLSVVTPTSTQLP